MIRLDFQFFPIEYEQKQSGDAPLDVYQFYFDVRRCNRVRLYHDAHQPEVCHGGAGCREREGLS